jgi:metalloendopeptidase OMA1, mitochondrial
MMKLTLKDLVVLLFLSNTLLFFTTSCTTVPYTGRHQFMMTSEGQEIVLGQKAWDEVQRTNQLSTNEEYNKTLQRIAKNITNNIKEKKYNWEFIVIESPKANAFCLPGGKIAVYSGFFEILKNDGELAAVVGHEVAHAIARHAGERMSHKDAAQISGEALNQVLSQEVPLPIPWLEAFGIASNVGVILPYSRTQEYEADYIGMIIMAKAGYNPQAAVEFWKTYAKQSDYDSITEFFTTHPMGTKRLKEIKSNIAKVTKYYKESKDKKGFGKAYNNFSKNN